MLEAFQLQEGGMQISRCLSRCQALESFSEVSRRQPAHLCLKNCPLPSSRIQSSEVPSGQELLWLLVAESMFSLTLPWETAEPF